MPELGANLRTDSLGRVTVDAENIREVHESLCYEASDNSRQFSPFEFTAKEFNDCGEGGWMLTDENNRVVDVFPSEEDARNHANNLEQDPAGYEAYSIKSVPSSEELWAAFEQGTGDAISADLATYTDEDYGIPLTLNDLIDQPGN